MSSTRQRIDPYKTVTNGDMSGNLTSLVTHMKNFDNICMQMVWTGVPVGTFAVQGSVDYSNVLGTGTWTPITMTIGAPSGSAGNNLLDMFGLSFPYIRVVYTFTSGTGSLNITVAGKGA